MKQHTCVKIMVVALLFLFSCKKNDSNTTQPSLGNVYVAGIYLDSFGTALPVVWENGKATILDSISGSANCVFVSNNDVYVCGLANNNNKSCAVIWKNNTKIYVDSTNETDFFSLCEDGNNVYAVGYSNFAGSSCPILWKNGIITKLSSDKGAASTIKVHEGNEYVVGYIEVGGQYRAVCWKNGVAQYLSNDNSSAYSIGCSGSDVYILGSTQDSNLQTHNVVWKNGNLIKTSALNENYSSLYVVNNDIYLSGEVFQNNNDIPTIWKNNTSSTLPGILSYNNTDGLCVNGSNVYIVGDTYFDTNLSKPVIWKNRTATLLSDRMGRAYSVFVN